MAAQAIYLAGKDDWLAPYLRGASATDLHVEIVDADAERVSSASDARVIVSGPEALTDDVLSAAGDLEFVQLTATEYESVDIAALEVRGVAVAGVSEALARPAAEHVVALLLEVAKKVGRPAGEDVEFPELSGKTLGLIGLGHLGLELARRTRCAVSDTRYVDVRTAPRGVARDLGLVRDASDRLLVASDYVIAQVPLTEQTDGLLDGRDFSLMEPEAIFVNASHPDVVNRNDLVEALQRGHIAAAGITYADSELERLDNVIALPYLAAPLGEVAERVADLIFDNLRRALAGDAPRSRVESITFPAAGDPAFWSSRMAPRVEEERPAR